MPMVIQTLLHPLDHENACEVLEAFGEGLVLAMMAEIRAGEAAHEGESDDELFPCCIKCGGFTIDGHRAVVDGAAELVRRGSACELSLVAYQVAQRRLEGKDPRANLIVEDELDAAGRPIPGRYHFLLQTSETDAAGRYIVEDPLAALRTKAAGCNCPNAPGGAAA